VDNVWDGDGGRDKDMTLVLVGVMMAVKRVVVMLKSLLRMVMTSMILDVIRFVSLLKLKHI
jgi:hypothetical protein